MATLCLHRDEHSSRPSAVADVIVTFVHLYHYRGMLASQTLVLSTFQMLKNCSCPTGMT